MYGNDDSFDEEYRNTVAEDDSFDDEKYGDLLGEDENEFSFESAARTLAEVDNLASIGRKYFTENDYEAALVFYTEGKTRTLSIL